ncbi:hypothetical protein [Fusobacterium sp. PH5-44]|uniref:hypothetical protein n=1 Tax=unclassified Fusobacterium TaxID=2648384 RepID=UPI003D1A09F9
MKKFLGLILFTICSVGVFAQYEDINELLKIKIVQKSDYKKNEKNALKLVNWYLAMPANEALDKKNDVSKWLDNWIYKNPNFSMKDTHGLFNTSQSSVLLTDKKNPLYKIYSYSRIKRFLEHGNKSSVPSAVEMTVDYYIKNKNVTPRNSYMERLVTMKKNGSLKAYLERPYIGFKTNSEYTQKNSLFQIEREGNGYVVITGVSYNFGTPSESIGDKKIKISENLFIKLKQLYTLVIKEKTKKPASGSNEVQYTLYFKESSASKYNPEKENIFYVTENNDLVNRAIKVCEKIHSMRYSSTVKEADVIREINYILNNY